MTQRTQRVDELLREEISRIIAREIEDPRVGFVTITRVEVSADLRHGTVWASVIGTADERRTTIKALGRAMPYVRHRLGELRIRRVPELHLRQDETAEKGTRVLSILQELEAGHEPDAAPTAETLPTPRRATLEPAAPEAPDAREALDGNEARGTSDAAIPRATVPPLTS
jgi:ribosome-binding factor A